jgi:hypothetical protein
MGSFWGGGESSGKIKHSDLEKHLKEIPHLERHHRERIIGQFDEYEHGGGIDKHEIDKAVREMIEDQTDGISPEKARQIKEHLQGVLKGDHIE